MSKESKSVIFLCNSNRGKSQMAEALARKAAPEWKVYSAGVQVNDENAGRSVNPESAASLARVGADMSQGSSKPVDGRLIRAADYVVVVGGAAFEMPKDAAGEFIRWEIIDPSERGVEGEQRMDALRDDIQSRVQELVDRS